MSKLLKNIKVSVDTGEIAVLVQQEETSYPIKKGKYLIELTVKESWRGKTSNKSYLDVKKDSYLAIRDGFEFDDGNLLSFSNSHKKGCVVSTGGDGEFSVSIKLTPCSKIGPDLYKEFLKKAKFFLKGKKYSTKLKHDFVKKFLHNAYDEEVDSLLQDLKHKKTDRSLKEIEKFLKILKTTT